MEVEILSEYIDLFRDLVNSRVQRVIPDTGDEDYPSLIKKSLKLNKVSDWSFICTAMDIVGDCNLSFENFLKFGLDGPTRIKDYGEKYLRLYGLLNATYIQQQAILNLFTLCQLPNPKTCKKKIENLSIRTVRHQIGAHANDYLNPESQTLESFVPTRMTLGGFYLQYINNNNFEFSEVNLKVALEEHIHLMSESLDSIYVKLTCSIYKNDKQKQNEIINLLSNVRAKREGKLVIKILDDESIIFDIKEKTPPTEQ